MIQRLITILFFLTISCKTKTLEWQLQDFGTFQLKTPDGWKKFKQQGIDSYVGGLTNGKDTLVFNYGWYSPEFDLGAFDDSITYLFAVDTIEGKVAHFIKPETSGKGLLGLSVRNIDSNKNGLALYGFNIQNQDIALNILKSISFKESQTNQSKKDDKLSFASTPFKSGKLIYVNNCASCHSVTKELTGPALNRHFEFRSHDWIYEFLTHRNEVPKDSLMLSNIKTFGRECDTFPDMSNSDFLMLFNYIKSR